MRMLLRRRPCGSRRRAARRLRSLVLAFALTLVAAMPAIVPAASVGVLDQAQPDVGFATAAVGDDSQVAQTFRSGITGSLDKLDLGVSKDEAGKAPLTVEIWAVSAGVPVGPVLASESLSAASLPAGLPRGFVSVPLGQPVSVTAGADYAIVLTSTCGNAFCYEWAVGHATNPYRRGLIFWRPKVTAAWVSQTLEDLAFKTYVVPAVPSAGPTSKADCKNGGWKRFTNPSFKNQGQCIAYVNRQHGKR